MGALHDGGPWYDDSQETSLMTSDQVNAGLRHLGTASVTAVTILGGLGVLSSDQLSSVIDALHQVTGGLEQVFGGVSKLVLVLGPIAAIWFGKGAVTAASLRGQLRSITSNPKAEIRGEIVVPASVAAAVPSDKVVAPTPPTA